MTSKAFFLLLQRQVTQKWGRFLLASAGIMIGVWAILLTTGLSLGLSDTIINAINSQPAARQISLYKLNDGKTSFFDLQGPPKFVSILPSDAQKVADKNSDILEIQPSGILSIYAQTDKADSQTNCTQLSGVNTPPTTPTAATSGAGISLLGSSTADPSFASKCQKITIPSSIFEDFYQSNRVNWYGQTGKPGRGEIVSCFKCGDINLREQLGVSNPQDMVGKTLRVELNQAPNVQIAGSVFDVTSSTRSAKVIKQSPVMELKIVAVVDDRNSSGLSLSGSASNNFYVDNSYFTDAVKLSDPSFDLNKAGYIEYNIFLKNYNSLENVSNNIRGDGYVAFSLVEGVVNGVKVAFLVLAGILAAFGFIALIASLFGIVNVMIISVLERQKQIGILKALGSRDRDIFNLFLLESMFLGVLGWLLGSLAAVFSGFLINVSFNLFIQSNSTFKANLNNLNISDFSPSFPWWSFVGTLAISVFFTSLAGVYPASKASKQNPVEVLRSE